MAYLIGILVVEHGLESLSRGQRLSSGAGRGLRPKECPRQPTHVADGVTTVTLSSAVALTVIAADPQATTRARTQHANGGDDHPPTHAYTHTHTHTHTHVHVQHGWRGGLLATPTLLGRARGDTSRVGGLSFARTRRAQCEGVRSTRRRVDCARGQATTRRERGRLGIGFMLQMRRGTAGWSWRRRRWGRNIDLCSVEQRRDAQ